MKKLLLFTIALFYWGFSYAQCDVSISYTPTGNSNEFTFYANNIDSLPGSYSWSGDAGNHYTDSFTHQFNEPGIKIIHLTFLSSDSLCFTYDSVGFILEDIDSIYGCTDPNALNFNPLANISDGSCVYDTVSTQCAISISRIPTGNINEFTFYANNIDSLPGSYSWSGDAGNHYTDSFTYQFNEPGIKIIHLTFLSSDSLCFAYDSIGFILEDIDSIYGCTDTLAINYNVSAQIDNGSCLYVSQDSVLGCTDIRATNYNENAMYNDGSCRYTFETNPDFFIGCTDSVAINFNPNATQDNGSCLYGLKGQIIGCTDLYATNYDTNATIDNGSCQYTQSHLDSAFFLIPGCTIESALNYSAIARINNGSCVFAQDSILIPIVLNDGEIISDTITSGNQIACEIDFSKLIDSASIERIDFFDNNAEITWAVWQQGNKISIVTYTNTSFSLNETNLVYATISCSVTRREGDERIIRAIANENRIVTNTNTISSTNGQTSSIFPNPAKDIIYIKGENTGNVKLVNTQGIVLMNESITSQSINISHLESGTYILLIENENSVSKHLIIKQ